MWEVSEKLWERLKRTRLYRLRLRSRMSGMRLLNGMTPLNRRRRGKQLCGNVIGGGFGRFDPS